MSIDAREPASPASNPARLFSLPAVRLAWPLRLLIALVALGVIAAVGYLAYVHYPEGGPPQRSVVERQAAAVFSVPSQGIDSNVAGDLLVERFYALDVETGDRYVADFLKGRIQGLQSLGAENAGPYLALLDLRNLQRDRGLYAAFVDAVARPQGNYLGLRTFSGASDAFRLNYDGSIPYQRSAFRGPHGEGIYDYLLTLKYNDVSKEPKLIRNDGYNYLLNSTDLFPFFRSEFRTGKALLLSELIIVDTTAPAQKAKLLLLQTQFRTPIAR